MLRDGKMPEICWLLVRKEIGFAGYTIASDLADHNDINIQKRSTNIAMQILEDED